MIPDLTHLCVSALFSEWLPSSNRGNALPCPHPDGETERGREGGRGKERAGIRSSSLQADWASLGHMPTPRLVIVAEGRPWVLDCVLEPISGKENGLTIVHLDPTYITAYLWRWGWGQFLRCCLSFTGERLIRFPLERRVGGVEGSYRQPEASPTPETIRQ